MTKLLTALATLLLASLLIPGLESGEVTPITTEVEVERGVNERGGADPSAEKIELGRLLFFDKILSGNRNISCATCHHPSLATADGVALGLGEGAERLGSERRAGLDFGTGVHARIPRNAPALFNLGEAEFTKLFHDGRVEVDREGHYESGFITPAKWKLPSGLDNVLAAQAMFPVGSPEEMAGQKGENPIADAVALNRLAGPQGAWARLSARLRTVPEYVERFQAAYPVQVGSAADISFVLAANAIAAFEADAFRSDDSPFDRYLAGDDQALDETARAGMDLFYGKAGCGNCHAGLFQTDHQFHAIAMPQLGPGKGDGSDTRYWSASGERAFVEDFGRGRVTVRSEDQFKFRTPSLRNVELTGPWGHAGAFDSLEEVVRHHLDPVASLETFRMEEDMLPPLDGVLELTMAGSSLHHRWLNQRRLEAFLSRDAWVQSQASLRGRIAEANELEPTSLSDDEVRSIVVFLRSLTDARARDLGYLVPDRVPSGLAVDR